MNQINIKRDSIFINELKENLSTNNNFSNWELFNMAYQAELSKITPQFTGLISLKHLEHMDFLPHQIDAATLAIESMNGRAILADEVGLGKTIEAGLILKEYMVRGLVKKALILVPASLVNQWVNELNEKFYIPAVAYRKNYSWDSFDIIVSSIDTAKRTIHKNEILKINFDFLLVDEAHILKNHKTINYSFVSQITTKFCLLLTATPIQNQLIEIFNLISILKPGLLGNYDAFLKKHGKNRNIIKQDKLLSSLVKKVMIRNTRKETKLTNIKRNIKTVWLDFTEKEQNAYDLLNSIGKQLPTFSKITFLKELCSSREACYLSLKKITDDYHKMDSVIEEITQLPHHIKAKQVVKLIEQIDNEKVIVFTNYRATQYYLQWYLQQHNISSVPFHGGFSKGKKEWMKQLFASDYQVLIATEAGSEGINLQFCNHLINYDLPWSPMKLEQRIGRIHRYGQKNDVQIYNLVINNTIEEHIMKLLYEKIGLFEKVVGRLDEILTSLEINNLEKELEMIHSQSLTQGEINIKLNNLSSIINAAEENL